LPQTPKYPTEAKHIAFLVEKLRIGVPGDRSGFSWLKYAIEATDEKNLVYKSSRCLAEVFYGRYFRSEGSIKNGMSRYGEILQLLREEVQDPMSRYGADLIQAIMTAVTIESTVSHSVGGLHAHIAGLAQIILRGGPQAVQRRPNIPIFEMFRCFIVGISIIHKRKTFLADIEWKTIPWVDERKSAFMELWDIL
jgi:hypothetical protein